MSPRGTMSRIPDFASIAFASGLSLFFSFFGIAIAHTDVFAGIGLPSTPSGS